MLIVTHDVLSGRFTANTSVDHYCRVLLGCILLPIDAASLLPSQAVPPSFQLLVLFEV